MMTKKGLDGLEARPMELLMKSPPTLLRKRKETGSKKYCLRGEDGSKTNVTNRGPAVAPADRRKMNGRRRMVGTNTMVEDGPPDPAEMVVVEEQNGGRKDVSKRSLKPGTILHFLVNSPNIGMKNGGGVERDGGENDVMDPRIGNG